MSEIAVGLDPTKAILSESALDKKYLCDYNINTATGCKHGCKFCYVPSSPQIRARAKMLREEADVENPQKEWGEYLLHRPEETATKLKEKLKRKRKWKHTRGGQGIVALSFSTDCYQDAHTSTVTRGCIEALINSSRPNGDDIYTRILTRNPILALQDIDIYKKADELITIGSSIPSFNNERVSIIEPRAPLPEHRFNSLKEFAEQGVNTYVSMSPTYPTLEKDDIFEMIKRFEQLNPNVVFHEPINHRGGNMNMLVKEARNQGDEEFAKSLETISTVESWVDYSIKHLKWVQQAAEYHNVPIHLWPDDELIKHTSGNINQWLTTWKNRQSVEDFAERNSSDTNYPDIPENNGQKTFDYF